MLSQGAGGRGAALGPALSRPASSPAEAPLERSEMRLPLLAAPRPPQGPQAAENGAREAEGTGRGEG